MWSTHVEPGVVPDLMAMAGEHLALNLGTSRKARLLKYIAGLSGLGRLLRFVINRSYRSGLEKEGYDDVQVGAHQPAIAEAHPAREVRIVEVRRETPSAVTLVLSEEPDFLPGRIALLYSSRSADEVIFAD